MAKKLFVQLQTPVIEMPVTAIDASGKKARIIVGFKRHTLTEVEKIFTSLKDESITTDFEQLVKSDILYLKEITLEVQDVDTGTNSLLIIKDTREAKSSDDWNTPEECLAVLLDMYFDSAPWKKKILQTYETVLMNVEKDKELEAKN